MSFETFDFESHIRGKKGHEKEDHNINNRRKRSLKIDLFKARDDSGSNDGLRLSR